MVLKCVKCGKTRDTRLGWCFTCASKPKGSTMSKTRRRTPSRDSKGRFKKRRR